MDKWIRVVGNLLERAMHPGTPKPEADAAYAKAQELMVKYKVDMTKVQAEKGNGGLSGQELRVKAYNKGLLRWPSYLAGAIGKVFDCHTLRSEHTGTQIFIGTCKEDLENATALFDHLQFYISALSYKHYKKVKDREAYGQGCVHTLKERLKEFYSEVEALLPSDCRALVVRKDEIVQRYKEEAFPNARSSSYTTSLDYGAWNKGKEEAKGFDISGKRKVGAQTYLTS